MKQYYTSRKRLGMLLAPLALVGLPLAIQAVAANGETHFYEPGSYTLYFDADTTSGIAGANYVSRSNSNNYPVVGLNVIRKADTIIDLNSGLKLIPKKEIEEVSVCGVKMNSNNDRFYFPDTLAICIEDTVIFAPSEFFNFVYHTNEQGDTQSFPEDKGVQTLVHIYLPQTARFVSWDGNGFKKLRNFHFTSVDVPAMKVSNGAEYCIDAYVPDHYHYSYSQYVNQSKIPVNILSENRTKHPYFYSDPYTLIVAPNTESGIADANYTNVRPSDALNAPLIGVRIMFDDNNNATDVTVRGVSMGSSFSSIYLPDSIGIEEFGQVTKYKVENFEFDYYTPEQSSAAQSFVNTENHLNHVFLPSTARTVTWRGQDFVKLRNFHFRSATFPSMSFQSGAEGLINVYVPNGLFDYYTTSVEEANYPTTVWSEDPAQPVYVNVEIPGTLADEIANNISNLKSVRWLVVTGQPNEQDMRIFRRLPYLEILDLSKTTGMKTILGCENLKYLHEVVLPEGLESISNGAFENCKSLQSIHLPASVKNIGSYAFQYDPIYEVNLGDVENIGFCAFFGSILRKVNLENLISIEGQPFGGHEGRYTRLDTLYLPNIKRISGGYSFASLHLKHVVLGEKIETIGDYAFENNDFETFVVPNGAAIYTYAFANNSKLKELILGDYRSDPYNTMFSNLPSLTKVSTTQLFPPEPSGFRREEDWSNVSVYVPAITLNEYLVSDAWSMMPNIYPSEDELTDIILDRTFTLTRDRGIADKANLTLNPFSHLTVRRSVNAPLNLGKYTQYHDQNGVTTLIAESEITADDIELNVGMAINRWTFISLPFDVNVSDIKTSQDVLWVVREYSGEARAAVNGNTWQTMADGTVLKAGHGYIFHCTTPSGYGSPTFTFRPAAGGNGLFAREVVKHELTEYPSEFAHNASWNLVGNPYPAYLNIKALNFEGPVTVWDSNDYYGGYRAYSPIDDEFALSPFEAFFVQRQPYEGGDSIGFRPEGRAHSREEALAIEFASAEPQHTATARRPLFNIILSGDNGSDRTRVVLNQAASMAYESNRDAAKFMSTDAEAAQIYVLNGDVRMAIDERPMGNGEVKLGSNFGVAGEYSISLESRRAEGYKVILTDTHTGVRTDITTAPYVFKAAAGNVDSRFVLTFEAEITGIDEVAADGICVNVNGNELNVLAPEAIDVIVTAVDGRTVAAGHSNTFSATLAQGIYVVKAGSVTTKVAVGK